MFLRNVTILSLRKRFFQWGSVIYNKGLQTTLKSLNVFRCCYFESCQNSDVVTQWNLIEGTKYLMYFIKKNLKMPQRVIRSRKSKDNTLSKMIKDHWTRVPRRQGYCVSSKTKNLANLKYKKGHISGKIVEKSSFSDLT